MCLNLNVFAEITVKLNFPKKSTAKMTAPKSLEKPQVICGNLIIDINPYPGAIEEDRYLVQYFLGDQLFYQTTGYNEENPDTLSFRYILDTNKFENGSYKLTVNFWDKNGPSAIGIREIVIKNE